MRSGTNLDHNIKNINTLTQNSDNYVSLFVSLSKDVIAKRPIEILRFVKSLNVDALHLERITVNGSARKNNHILPSNKDLDRWFVQLYEDTVHHNAFGWFDNVFLNSILRKFTHGTKEATFCRNCEQKIFTINGHKDNFKITDLEDLNNFKKLKKGKIYFGIGFDIHRLAKKRKLFLGGIKIPYSIGLQAHSDGDPVLHALIDSLLGASGLNDIGTIFSDKNKKYKNIRSTKLLERVVNLMLSKNILINNIDVNIIAQRPKINKFKKRMISLISKICKIDEKEINIKGKTTEKLGIIGNEKAIASEVITSVIKYD